MHSKNTLLFIVILNILDCVLVLGELFLDIYYLKGVMDKEELGASLFMEGMKQLYPRELINVAETDIDRLYNIILSSTVDFPSASSNQHNTLAIQSSDTIYSEQFKVNYNESLGNSNHSVVKRSVLYEEPRLNKTLTIPGADNSPPVQYRIEVKLAHLFHYFSLSILTILVIENICKVFCSGKEFFEKKLEVFDAVVVVFSFVLDLVFIKGIHVFKVQKFLIILVILVPWRIIRVVNSLIVAVTDHAHFRMKLLYKQKKTVTQDLRASKNDIKTLQDCVESLRELALLAGVSNSEVDSQIAAYKISTKKEKHHNNVSEHSFLSSFAVGHLGFNDVDHLQRPGRQISTSESAELISVKISLDDT
ncbi:uncharacterized protein LOC125648421 isoform X2 [Ostrea edulis]|nr:uncharacterized protein LOC125648421 isoform X2 [Ostrea edulis]